MNYPTLEQVQEASHIQLAKWYRFLPSPGGNHIGNDDFEVKMEEERAIQTVLLDRFQELGGMNPGISKAIGWEL